MTTNRFIEAGRTDVSGFGARLANARKDADFTQHGLATAMGVARSTIAQYEGDHATPPISVIIKLAEAVGVDPRTLIFGGDADQGYNPFLGGRLIPIGEAKDDESFEPVIGLPAGIVADFGVKTKELRFFLLDVSAPYFGVRDGAYLLVETGINGIASDGTVYVMQSSAGLALVRSEPQYQQSASKHLYLTDGNGLSRETELPEVYVLGRLVAVLQNQPMPLARIANTAELQR